MFDSLAWAMGAPPPSGQAAGAPDMFMSFFPLIVIFGIFYLLLIRPQQKKAKEHKEMLNNIKKGDKVITSGGVYGLVESVGDNTVVLKIAENVKVKFGKSFVAAVRGNQEED
ncbi:MAG: preprotein translocase subunit YajC [Candidatus Magnetominusculus sp. LBB02]|nr:preprotein translocase subunit YajC [Candidatus Magnetominusculus sp. LBB02]